MNDVGLLAVLHGLGHVHTSHVGTFVCKVKASVVVLATVTESFSILAIALDRFICVNWPLKYPLWFTERRILTGLVTMTTILLPLSFCFVFVPPQ